MMMMMMMMMMIIVAKISTIIIAIYCEEKSDDIQDTETTPSFTQQSFPSQSVTSTEALPDWIK